MPDVLGRDVLRAIHDGCSGLVELRALPSRVSAFYPSDDLAGVAAFIKEHYADHLYWGVATRKTAESGALENCQDLGALFVDLDDGKQPPSSEVVARRQGFPFPPSIVIHSGGGRHWYFLLKDPLNLQDAEDLRFAYEALRRLAAYLGGDLPVAEPARILRIPSTLNRKYQPPRQVAVTEFSPARRYNVSELLDWLPPAATAATASAAIDLSKPVRGERNVTLYKLGRGLKARGLPASVLADTIGFINRRCCLPPLDDWEIDQIVEHVVQQPDRPRPAAQTMTVVVG